MEKGIEDAPDLIVPHRLQAVDIAVAAQDEFELSRRDVAAARLHHQIGTPQELVRASNTVQMEDYRRKQEAPILKEQLGIELPASRALDTPADGRPLGPPGRRVGSGNGGGMSSASIPPRQPAQSDALQRSLSGVEARATGLQGRQTFLVASSSLGGPDATLGTAVLTGLA